MRWELQRVPTVHYMVFKDLLEHKVRIIIVVLGIVLGARTRYDPTESFRHCPKKI